MLREIVCMTGPGIAIPYEIKLMTDEQIEILKGKGLIFTPRKVTKWK